MAKKARERARARPVSANRVAEAMLGRVRQRIAAAGSLKIPAVPSLLEDYLGMFAALFAACARSLTRDELAAMRDLLALRLGEAFDGSQRSKVVLEFRAEAGAPLAYSLSAEVSPLATVYEKWLGEEEAPLFGAHADARVLAVAAELDPSRSRALDLGAGTGRNALALARLGFSVDAVELTPKFADILQESAKREALPVHVFMRDVFHARDELQRDYALFIASELVPDFRGPADLRRLLELAAEVLGEGGALVLNLHLAAQGYTPEKAAREFGQQSYSALFTGSEVEAALSGLPFELVSLDSARDYERKYLPEGSFPPTPWYENWSSGRDVYELPREECPIELCWLVCRKTNHAAVTTGVLTAKSRRMNRFDPAVLRVALVKRLQRRAAASLELTLPAVPSLLKSFTEMYFGIFSALGREFSTEQKAEGEALLAQALRQAFEASPRSNVVVTCEAPRGSIGRYTITPDPVALSDAYEEWLETLPAPLFGAYPDARLAALAGKLDESARVLDVGAGLGRNALPLARAGHAVDAVEPTPKFAEELANAARSESLEVRVITRDVFDSESELARDYGVVLISAMVADLRSAAELRRLFELLAPRVVPGGWLLLSAHVAVDGYMPTDVSREWAQQCCAMFFTKAELASAVAGLGLALVAEDPSVAYERDHSPEEAFPPTEAYEEWATATHLFALTAEESPVELRWLLYEKSHD
jgi:SAM-dependent methyltransferase